MTLEQFIPKLKKRCSDCGDEIPEGEERRIEKGAKKNLLCRRCFRKKLGAKEEG